MITKKWLQKYSAGLISRLNYIGNNSLPSSIHQSLFVLLKATAPPNENASIHSFLFEFGASRTKKKRMNLARELKVTTLNYFRFKMTQITNSVTNVI